MPSRLWGVPPIVAGLIIGAIVLAIGWTCPSWGTGFCSHAYITGWWLLAVGVGGALFVMGIVLIALGRKRPAG